MLRHLFSRRSRSPGPLNKSSSLFLLRGKRHRHSWVLGVISCWKMLEQIRHFRLSQQVKWESKKHDIVKLEEVGNSKREVSFLEIHQVKKSGKSVSLIFFWIFSWTKRFSLVFLLMHKTASPHPQLSPASLSQQRRHNDWPGFILLFSITISLQGYWPKSKGCSGIPLYQRQRRSSMRS